MMMVYTGTHTPLKEMHAVWAGGAQPVTSRIHPPGDWGGETQGEKQDMARAHAYAVAQRPARAAAAGDDNNPTVQQDGRQ
jgi:hypothetical protein